MKRSTQSLIKFIKLMKQSDIDVDGILVGLGIDAYAIHADSKLMPEIEWHIRRTLLYSLSLEDQVSIIQRAEVVDYGSLFMFVLCCDSLQAALDLTVDYQELTYLFGKIKAHDDEHEIGLIYVPMNLDDGFAQFSALYEMVGLYTYIKEVYSMMSVEPLEIRVSIPLLNLDLQHIAANIFGEYLNDTAQTAGIFLKLGHLGAKTAIENEVMYKIYRRKCIYEMKALAQKNHQNVLIDKIYDYMALQHGIMPTMFETAQILNIPERTLRHHLLQLKTSFKEIRDQFIQANALILIQNKNLNISEISRRLGYSETAAFNHAFKRWFGCSPSHYLH